MTKDKDYKKVLDSLEKDFGWADTKNMSYMEKDLVNDVIKAVKKLTIPVVSTRLSQMITDIDNKTMNTTYDDGEHLAWDKDDIRCIQRTLQLLNE